MGLLMSDQLWGGISISYPIFKRISFAVKRFRGSRIGANFDSCFLRNNVDYLDPVSFTRGRHGRYGVNKISLSIRDGLPS